MDKRAVKRVAVYNEKRYNIYWKEGKSRQTTPAEAQELDKKWALTTANNVR